MEKPRWRRLASERVVDTSHFRLRKDRIELPDGRVIDDYFVRESGGFAMIFALTPDRRVVLVRQYRYANDSFALELPAGAREADESFLACAQREFLEETGFEAQAWREIARFSAEPVRATSWCAVFLAENAAKIREPYLDLGEELCVELATLDEFREMLRDGHIESGSCIAAGYLALDTLARDAMSC